ncbi:MAG: HIT family protein [Sphingomonadales bacterium]
MNETIRKFGYPGTLFREFSHWLLLIRPDQVTMGSLVLAAKSEATAFGALQAEAFSELGEVVAATERALKGAFKAEKFNYLMLMMVDPHVHFHLIPRYSGPKTLAGVTIEDAGWPGLPELGSAVAADGALIAALKTELGSYFQ